MATLAVGAAAFKNALPKLPRLPPYEGLVFMLHRRINILLEQSELSVYPAAHAALRGAKPDRNLLTTRLQERR